MRNTVRAGGDPARDVDDPLADYEPPGKPLPPPAVPVDLSPVAVYVNRAEPTYSTRASESGAAGHAQPAESEPAGGPAGTGKGARAGVLVAMAKECFDVWQSGGDTVVTPRGGRTGLPQNIALPLHGRGGLGQQLRLLWEDARRESVPSASGLTDAVSTIDALGCRADEITLYRRFAHLRDQQQVVVDLGTPHGDAVVVTPKGWTVVPSNACPVVFARSPMARAHPRPAAGRPSAAGSGPVLADLALIQQYVNITDTDWPLLLGWLVAAHLEGPTPLLLLTGPAGTGKSTAARTIIDLVDPQASPLRQVPRDEDQLTISALGTAATAWDNASRMPAWLSDALCQLVTGQGRVVRKLYSDTDVVATYLRRPVIMTSIDAGALRGDLATRLLPIELTRLQERRLSEAHLEVGWRADRPRIHAALLTLISRILGTLADAQLSDAHRSLRMSDFAQVLAALDRVGDVPGVGGRALATYADSQVDVQITVAEGDPIATGVRALVDASPDGRWVGTWQEFLAAVAPSRDPLDKNWPMTSEQANGRVKRLTEALAALGVTFDRVKSNGVRKVRFTATTPPQEPRAAAAPRTYSVDPF